jgi:hypothetical protein
VTERDARRGTGLLAIDRVAIGYLSLTGALSLAGGPKGVAFTALHVFAIFLIVMMSRRPLPRGQLATFFRLLYPVIATPLLYHELSYLTQLVVTGFYDPIVQRWEVAVFGSQISQEAADWFPALWLSEFMTVGYLTYYFVIPLLAIGAWASAGRAGFHRLGVTVALAFAICYTWFILFPVMGPRYWYGALEGALSEGSIYQFTRELLAGGSSKGTAFPSSHGGAGGRARLLPGCLPGGDPHTQHVLGRLPLRDRRRGRAGDRLDRVRRRSPAYCLGPAPR